MKIIDITHDMEEGMLTFGSYWHPLYEITQIGRLHVEGRETRKIVFGTHTGTHMDAALHFVQNGASIEKLDLEIALGPVSIVDCSNINEDEPVGIDMIPREKIAKRMIFYFNWARFWNTPKFYVGYPFFSLELARYLVDNGVKLVGMDTASPDDSRIKLDSRSVGSAIDSPVHKIFLPNGVTLLEYLANLDQLNGDFEDWNISALPLRLKGADGSPVRACLFKQ